MVMCVEFGGLKSRENWKYGSFNASTSYESWTFGEKELIGYRVKL